MEAPADLKLILVREEVGDLALVATIAGPGTRNRQRCSTSCGAAADLDLTDRQSLHERLDARGLYRHRQHDGIMNSRQTCREIVHDVGRDDVEFRKRQNLSPLPEQAQAERILPRRCAVAIVDGVGAPEGIPIRKRMVETYDAE